MAVTDIATQATPGGEEMTDVDMTAELPAEEPEAEPTGGVGREKR
jgi:hypothetical protein